ncbi:hypothetical protein LOK49_LG01G00387 [Camellia lanceoleosa]|uniref:Uncharacterized protein n=1 Tax=Camellia lanceoleosa TaxID=1840588 RepID=A0ACC0IW09_9ERIC|nr:hypothetical protein LOK49_LG01G00387 [Camellia lanceoleosa]
MDWLLDLLNTISKVLTLQSGLRCQDSLWSFYFGRERSKDGDLLVIRHFSDNGLMPIVEPEILLVGEHPIGRTLEVAERVWAEVFY